MQDNTPTFYDQYFINTAGHMLDLRSIVHVSPVAYNKFNEEYSFRVLSITQNGEKYTVHLDDMAEDVVQEARDAIVAAHKQLWLPLPQPEPTPPTEAANAEVPEEEDTTVEAA